MKYKPFVLGNNKETKELFRQLKELSRPAIKGFLMSEKTYKKLKKLSTIGSIALKAKRV